MNHTIRKRPSFAPGGRPHVRPTPTAAEQRQIDYDIRIDRIAQYGDQMKALHAEARAFREQWGKFTRDGWRFDSVVKYGPYVSELDETAIRAGMIKTLADAAADAAEALAAPYVPVDNDNDMSDAEVAAGIRWLRVSGWNAFDKTKGDCCAGLLDVDYAGAIALARGIIGKHQKTLRKAGVIQ